METEINYSKRIYYFTLTIAVCSILTFFTLFIVAIIVVPKAVRLINGAQRTVENLEVVSEELRDLQISETISNIDDNTARAMQDVSESMEQLNELDMDALNQSIRDLSESVEEFKQLLGN